MGSARSRLVTPNRRKLESEYVSASNPVRLDASTSNGGFGGVDAAVQVRASDVVIRAASDGVFRAASGGVVQAWTLSPCQF